MSDEQPDKKIYQVALLVALACVLQISESMIPHPIPGLRLGLANMLTLTALVVLGFRYALEVAILRVVLSSFLMGTFMSPAFILSFGGALASTMFMGLFYWLSGLSRKVRMSMIGISIIGALAHNIVQLSLAYLLLIRHSGIFLLLPWLAIGAIGTGWLVGVVAGRICRFLLSHDPADTRKYFPLSPAVSQTQEFRRGLFTPGETWLHRLPAVVKLGAVLTFAILLLINTHGLVYLGGLAGLSVLIVISRTPPAWFLPMLRKSMFLILFSLLMPAFFISGNNPLGNAGIFPIDFAALAFGASLSIRIVLLILASMLLMRTTAPNQLGQGLGRMLWPLRVIGISPERVAAILTLSWAALPGLWEEVRAAIAAARLDGIRSCRNLLPTLCDLVADLYLRTEVSSDRVDGNDHTEKMNF